MLQVSAPLLVKCRRDFAEEPFLARAYARNLNAARFAAVANLNQAFSPILISAQSVPIVTPNLRNAPHARKNRPARRNRCLFERGQSLIVQPAHFDVERLMDLHH